MVQPNGETQPREALQADAGADGAPDIDRGPQEGTQPDGDQTGAEQAAEKPAERTYTQLEVSKMTSAFQRETQSVKNQLATLTRQLATDKAAATETAAKATDARAVEDGEITDAEARQREQNRIDLAASEQRLATTQAQTAQLDAQNEAQAVIKLAERFGAEFGIDPKLLLDDPASRSDPYEMREKSWQLWKEKQQAAVPGTETFDSGQVGSTGSGYQGYVQDLKDGKPLPSAEEIDRLTAGYANQR